MTDGTSISLEEQLLLQVKQDPAIYVKNHIGLQGQRSRWSCSQHMDRYFSDYDGRPSYIDWYVVNLSSLPLIHCYCIESAKKFQKCFLFMLT